MCLPLGQFVPAKAYRVYPSERRQIIAIQIHIATTIINQMWRQVMMHNLASWLVAGTLPDINSLHENTLVNAFESLFAFALVTKFVCPLSSCHDIHEHAIILKNFTFLKMCALTYVYTLSTKCCFLSGWWFCFPCALASSTGVVANGRRSPMPYTKVPGTAWPPQKQTHYLETPFTALVVIFVDQQGGHLALLVLICLPRWELCQHLVITWRCICSKPNSTGKPYLLIHWHYPNTVLLIVLR